MKIFFTLFLFLYFHSTVFSQTVAILQVNGVTRSLNDTIKICVNTSLTYNSISTNVSSTNYTFQNGTPATASTPGPHLITYNTAGVHETKLLVINGPDRDSTFIYVDVSNVKPTMDFTFTPNNVCGGTPINFTSNVTGGIAPLTYAWNFADGTTSTTQNDVHSFVAQGPPYPSTKTFAVKHYATTLYGCKDSITKTITLKTTPHDSIVRGSNTILFSIFNGFPTFSTCVNATSYSFSFINQSLTQASNTGYLIQWGDGVSPDSAFATWPTANIINHTFPLGNSVMTVTTTGSDGCQTVKKYNVFLGSNPSVGLTSPGNTSACAPASFTFGINGTTNNPPGTTYQLVVNDGSAPVNFTHPPPTSYTHLFNNSSCGTTSTFAGNPFPNSYTATIIARNPCGSTPSGVASIYISKKPCANIIVSPSNVICANTPLTFINATTSGAFINPGNASTCVISGNQVWSISPSTGYTINSGSLGNTFGTTNTAVWQNGTGVISVSFSNPGNYIIKLYAANDCGIDSTIRTICVRTPPTALFTMSADSSCGPMAVDFTNTSPLISPCVGNIANWTVAYSDPLGCTTGATPFTFTGGTTATSISPRIQFNMPGRYIIRLTMRANSAAIICPNAFVQDTFWVKEKPKVTINPIASICANNTIAPTAVVSNCYGVNGPNYAWTFTNGTPNTSSAINPTIILYTTTGTFAVNLDITNECGTTTATRNVIITNPPTANAGIDKEICSGFTTSIGSNAVAGVTYVWSPTTGLSNANAATTNATLTYTGINSDTTLTYIVTASIGTTCSNKDTVAIIIKKGIALTFNPTTASICNGDSVQLVVSGGNSYVWSPTTSLRFITADTVMAKPTTNTTYNVSSSAINGCSANGNITVMVKPLPNTNAGNDVTICNTANAYQLVGTPSGGTWSGITNVNASGVFNAVAAGVGSYQVYHNATLNGCSKLDSAIVNVIAPVIPTTGNDTTICQNGASFNVTASPNGGAWSGTALINSSGLFNPTLAGTFTVTYSIGSGTCLSTVSKQVIVRPIIANNTIAASQQICVNNIPSIINGSTPSGGNGTYTFQWQQSNDGVTFTNIILATSQNYQPVALTNTTYYRRVVTSFTCATHTSNIIAVTIKYNAVAQFTAAKVVGCAPFVISNSSNINAVVLPTQNGTYNWYINSTLLGTNTTGVFPGYTMTVPGDTITIRLIVQSQFGCKPDTMELGFKTLIQPSPALSKSSNGGCAPIAITFTNNTPSLNNYQYYWNFGNGQTSNIANPLPVIYNVGPTYNDTIYTIKLGAFAGCDTLYTTTTVAIKSKPKAIFAPVKVTGCSPFIAKFVNNSLGMRIKFYWDFGDGRRDTTLTKDTVFHTYNTGTRDTFNVRLIAENECGRDTVTYNIIVDPRTLELDFTYNATSQYGCLPHTVAFFNNSVGGNNFVWNFGDGNTQITSANVDTVYHTFTTAGTFIVKLRGQNDCTDTTGQESITTFAKPLVNFSALPTSVCVGDTVRFTNTSEAGLTLLWKFGDGTTSTLINPKKIYSNAGNYIATLIGSKVQPSGLVCSDSMKIPITVLATRPGSFTVNDSVSNCYPFTVNFTNTSTQLGTVLWDFGNGVTGTGNTTPYTYTQVGVYTVTMTATDIGGCKFVATKIIRVNGPTGTLSYIGGNKCNNATIAFTATTSSTAQYFWNFGDGATQTTNFGTITHTYNTAGSFVPSVKLINGTCEILLKTNDTIKVDKTAPNFGVSFTYNCGSTTINILDSSNAFFGIQSYAWNLGNGQTSNLQNPTATYTASGNYTIRLVMVSKLGCVDSISKTIFVQVNTKPTTTISVPTFTTCVNQPFSALAVVNSIDPIGSVQWQTSNGITTTSINPTFLFGLPGTYTIKLIASTIFGCKDSTTINVTVNPTFTLLKSLDARICLGQNTNLAVSGAATYSWSPSNGLSCNNCPNPIATPTTTTKYIVTATSASGCIKKDSIEVEVVQPFNINVTPALDTICAGETVQLTATNGTLYTWQPNLFILPNATVPNPVVAPLTTTTYMVVSNDIYNCFTDTGYSKIVVGQPAGINLGPDKTVTTGTTIQLQPVLTNGPFNNFMWSPITNLSCTNCPNPAAVINDAISYIVTGNTIYGCAATDTINIKVFCQNTQVYLPNGFKPTGTNKYMVRGQGIKIVKIFKIFNRAGQVVFERNNFQPNDPNFGWDGTLNGQLSAPDVFVYYCEVVCSNGTPFNYKGNITLVR